MPTLKKYLSSLDKTQIIDFVTEMYKNSKPAKQYIDHFLKPESGKAVLQKYKKIIEKEFYPIKPSDKNFKFSVANKAIKEFSELKPDPIYLAELMLFLPEIASRFTHDFGDMYESFYIGVEKSYQKALSLISKHDLLDHFKAQALLCFEYSQDCGWGFGDAMGAIYYNYYEE